MRKLSRLLILAAIILLVGFCAFLWRHCPLDHKELLSGLLGSLCGSLVALIAILFAIEQLDAINKTASADFLMKLKNDFFTKEARILINLLDLDCIKFVKNDDLTDSFFEVDESKINNSKLPTEHKKDLLAKKHYTLYEIDDFLLGHFEDVGILVNKGIIDVDVAYEEFFWYASTAWENCEINKYIREQRKDGLDTYDKFEEIYKEFETYRKKKLKLENNQCRFWLKFSLGR